MEFNDLVRIRESIRDYDPNQPVSKEVLERILETAHMAPSAVNKQPWEFWVVQSPEMLAKVRACYHRPWYKEAPVILVIVGDKNSAWVRQYDGYNSIETDLAILMTHVILAAENEGVGACYIEAYDPAMLREALGLTENQVVFGLTPLGYPHAGFRKRGNKSRKALHEVLRYL